MQALSGSLENSMQDVRDTSSMTDSLKLGRKGTVSYNTSAMNKTIRESALSYVPENPDDTFAHLSTLDEERFLLSVKLLDNILKNEKAFNHLPNFINGRQVSQNLLLIRTCLCIILRGFMDIKELHEALLSFEIKCRELSKDTLPLNENIIQDCLITINLSINPNVFYMWCRKCWRFLMFTSVETHKKPTNSIGTILDATMNKYGAGDDAL